ncbi:T-complex protein 1 subunit delta [Venturia inaequalis]|nr:T-complex protein 1 subunit delta [Venturia inaequalis]
MDTFLGDSAQLAQGIGYPSSTVPGPTSSWVTEEDMDAYISQENQKKKMGRK